MNAMFLYRYMYLAQILNFSEINRQEQCFYSIKTMISIERSSINDHLNLDVPGVARKSLHSLLLKQNQAYGKMASNQSEAKNPLQYDI